MSGLALRLEGDEWLPWLPDRSHPSYVEYRMLRMQTYGENYGDQKQLLDKLYEKIKEDVFVASFKAIRDTATGEVVSYCLWSKGCHALLPRTDRVFFYEEGREPVGTDWDRATAVVGDLMKPIGMFPERYRVFEYPTEDQFKAMSCKRCSRDVPQSDPQLPH